MKHAGKITITRQSRTTCGDSVCIELTDESSGTRVVEVEMTVENFGNAITNLALQPCEFQWYPEAPVGKVRETKTEIIQMPEGASYAKDREALAKAAIAPFEVDGWVGYWRDALNHHRHTDGTMYSVGFHRFVDRKYQEK